MFNLLNMQAAIILDELELEILEKIMCNRHNLSEIKKAIKYVDFSHYFNKFNTTFSKFETPVKQREAIAKLIFNFFKTRMNN
jgi:hypothetical protein